MAGRLRLEHIDGYKQSGFGGHDKSVLAHDQYTELKTIWFHLAGAQ